jgi:hypothetical protein
MGRILPYLHQAQGISTAQYAIKKPMLKTDLSHLPAG